MTSEVPSGSSTMRGLKAIIPMAERDQTRQEDLVNIVGAILAPDTKTALQKRAGGIKPDEKRKEPAKVEKANLARKRSAGRRKEGPTTPEIEVNGKQFAEDIKTTKDMADEVTNILGSSALDALKTSCHQRKSVEKKNKKEKQEKKEKIQIVRTKPRTTSKLLTPEMQEAMERQSKGNVSSKAVASQNKIQIVSTDEEDDASSSLESEKGASLRQGSSRSKIMNNNSRQRGGRRSPRNKRLPARTRSSDGGKTPSGRRRPAASRKGPRKIKSYDDEKLRENIKNHSEDVAIDLEDGMDEIFDMEDESSKKNQNKGSSHRKRRPRKVQSEGVSGAAPGRRGRCGKRGGGTRLGNIRTQQAAMMTAVDQTKQFPEDAVVPPSEPESEESIQEQESDSSQEGLFSSTANRAVNVVGSTANMAAGAATGGVRVAAGLATTTAGLATTTATGAVGVATGAAGVAAGLATTTATGAAELAAGFATATGAADLAAGFAKTTAGGALFGVGEGVFGVLGTAANTATKTMASTAGAITGGTGGHMLTDVDVFTDAEDEPTPSAGDGGWGFTGGGLK